MKKLAVAFLFCLNSTIANAQIGPQFVQVPKVVVCGPADIVFKGLTDDDIKEQPLWVGKDESSKSDYALFVNEKTMAFTLIQYTGTTACILGLGYKSEIYKLAPNEKRM